MRVFLRTSMMVANVVILDLTLGTAAALSGPRSLLPRALEFAHRVQPRTLFRFAPVSRLSNYSNHNYKFPEIADFREPLQLPLEVGTKHYVQEPSELSPIEISKRTNWLNSPKGNQWLWNEVTNSKRIHIDNQSSENPGDDSQYYLLSKESVGLLKLSGKLSGAELTKVCRDRFSEIYIDDLISYAQYNKDRSIIVNIANKEIKGFAIFSDYSNPFESSSEADERRVSYIDLLCTEASTRGVGKQLLRSVEDYLAAKPSNERPAKISLFSAPLAGKFYQSQGYVKVEGTIEYTKTIGDPTR